MNGFISNLYVQDTQHNQQKRFSWFVGNLKVMQIFMYALAVYSKMLLTCKF